MGYDDDGLLLRLSRHQMGFAGSACSCVTLRDVDTRKYVASKVTTEVLIEVNLQPHEVRVFRASCE
jgi:hypothetical protein